MPEKNTKFDTRLDQRNQKRKKNNILNILIGIVLLLIIIVTVNIVTNDDDKESANSPSVSSSQEEENKDDESVVEEEDVEESVEVADTNTESNESSSSNEDVTSETEEDTSDNAEGTETETGTVTTESSNDPNVESVIIDSGWQPIGTTQTGDHVSSYTKNTVDWDEKVKALAYAANLDPSNMYVPFIGNGGSPQKSIGTVTSKDRSEIYRVYLEWVDGEGWKPTKKEKLKAVK